MDATVEEVAALADVEKFMSETGIDNTSGECHNALTWLAIQIKRAKISTHNIWLCSGYFAGRDHSWIQVEDINDETQTIIDMTVDQFGDCEVPYVGPVSPGYLVDESILLSDQDNIMRFITGLG